VLKREVFFGSRCFALCESNIKCVQGVVMLALFNDP
jgi:hypothetical protein